MGPRSYEKRYWFHWSLGLLNQSGPYAQVHSLITRTTPVLLGTGRKQLLDCHEETHLVPPLGLLYLLCCALGEADLCGCVGLVMHPCYSKYGPWRDSTSIIQNF